MSTIVNKYRSKPSAAPLDLIGRFERFNLKENPFPSQPTINQESDDARYNGEIYERSIRQPEYNKLQQNFLRVPQNDPNHLRLGYLIDTSYIGRGNGKSAFLINAQRDINHDFCRELSNGVNKCFALTISPEPSGRTKTFANFVDLFMATLFRTNLVDDVLAGLRLDAILSIRPDFPIEENFRNEDELRHKLNSFDWYKTANLDYRQVHQFVQNNTYLQPLPADFPLYQRSLFDSFPTRQSFEDYYRNLRPGKPRLEFAFSDLVRVFLGAGFNGAYIFVDDYERIPDFQSERQKRDFALELRSCLFDGYYVSAQIGFFNMLLVLHAGVPRLIQKAWEQSGLEHRVPMFYRGGTPNHIIPFEKIAIDNVHDLVKRYLAEYRIRPETDTLNPFSSEAIAKIAELGEFNTSQILKMSYEVLERAASTEATLIDLDFLNANNELIFDTTNTSSGIYDAETVDLSELARKSNQK